jgi:hypothetical protein
MNFRMALPSAAFFSALALAIGFATPTNATMPTAATGRLVEIAQAMAPPTGANDDENPMAMEERMRKRFPQPVRVGDLIGLPVLDDSSSTLGFVQHVVRTPENKIELVVTYSRWWGWFGRPIAVPIEVVGIAGRQLASLDMDADDYADAPTWQDKDSKTLPNDEKIQIALARH